MLDAESMWKHSAIINLGRDIMDQQFLEIEKKSKRMSLSHRNLSIFGLWFNLILSGFTFLILLVILGITISCYSDASITINDLKMLSAEARDTLRMVRNICNSPSFSQYCSD